MAARHITTRIFTTALIAMISAVAVSAQVWVGVQASVMNVGLSSPSIPDLQLGNDIGYSLGGLVEVEIVKDVRLSLQPAYSNFGTMVQTRRVEEIDGAKTDVYVDTLDLSFSYLSVPFLMKVANSSGVVHAIAGIQPNLRIASRSDNQFTGETADLTDKTRSVTLDMIFGLGVNLSLWSQPIVIDLRYVQGLTEIPTPETVNDTTVPDGMRMSGFQLCVSWLLPIVGGEEGGAK